MMIRIFSIAGAVALLMLAVGCGGVSQSDHDAAQLEVADLKVQLEAAKVESAAFQVRILELEAIKTPPELVLEDNPKYQNLVDTAISLREGYDELEQDHRALLAESNRLAATQSVLSTLPEGLWEALVEWAPQVAPDAVRSWADFLNDAGPTPPRIPTPTPIPTLVVPDGGDIDAGAAVPEEPEEGTPDG